MIQRIRIIPYSLMAEVLAPMPAALRTSPEAAAAVLLDAHFMADEIAIGLEEAMRLAAEIAVASASDSLWARALGVVRDLAACAAIIAAVALWAMPA